MRRLILLFFLFQTIHCSCPDGFELVAAGECRETEPIFYGILTNDQATETAISKCKALQAQPVIIHDDEQEAYWTEKYIAWKDYPILGLTCNTTSMRWVWTDGSALDYKPPPSAGYHPDLDTNCKSGCVWYMGSGGYWYELCGSNTYDYDIYCTSQLPPLPVPNADGCESFEDDIDDGMCYQVGATAGNWQAAQSICGRFGGNVASIHNDKENSFIRRVAVSKGAVNGVYLGASVSGKGNDFSWIDGSKWDYNNFYPGFPINGLGQCIIMDTGAPSGEWANVDCSTAMAVACERKQHFVPTCISGPWTEGQYINTPGFPYTATMQCDVILSVASGKKVELEVLFLEANSCCDNLVVYENYFGSNIIANLTGEISDKKYTTASSNFMRVSWQPNGAVNVRGAVFTFHAV